MICTRTPGSEEKQHYAEKLGIQAYTVPSHVSQFPKQKSLATSIHAIKNQQDIGACTAFSASQAGEIVATLENPSSWVELSPKFLYNNEFLADGNLGQDVGSTILRSITEVCMHGICAEKLDPFVNDIRCYSHKPTVAQYSDGLNHMDLDNLSVLSVPQDRNHFLAALNQGHPILRGYRVYESFESNDAIATGRIPVPDTDQEELLGGHALPIVNYFTNPDTSISYVVANSWGTNVGAEMPIYDNKKSRGFFILPAEFVESSKFGSDFHIIKNFGKKPTPAPAPAPIHAKPAPVPVKPTPVKPTPGHK